MFQRLSSDHPVFVSEKKLIETLLKTTEMIRKHEQTWSNQSRLWSQAQFLTSILSEPISNSGLVSLLEVRTDCATDAIQKLKLIVAEIELNTTSNHPYHEYAILSPSMLRAGTEA